MLFRDEFFACNFIFEKESYFDGKIEVRDIKSSLFFSAGEF